jgi:signal transduction histidine kinase
MPLWRQRPLFWVVGVLGALLAAYGLVLLRTGQLKRREMRLTQLVNEKTRVLQETAVMTQRQAGELTRLNRQLQKTNADLSMAMQQKQEFLSVIAHDLKNPLHAIKGFSELLLLPRSDLSQARAYATTIASEAMKMSHLLDELVESGRLESNLAHLLVRDENLALILQQTVAVFLPLAEKKQQTIRYMGPDHLPIVGDRTVLERVFQNLLSNAVKYSPHSSCIDVFLRLTDQAIECGVQDEGPGIAPADRDRLFVKFAKLSNQPTGGETSHGIGLYITKLLVELHSGQIQMLPVEPSGCCFQISLPAQGCWLKPPEDHGPGGITKDQIEENNREGD